MNDTIKNILERAERTGGPGASIPDEDRNDLREYLVEKLVRDGAPWDEAFKIVQAFYWGSWSEGWGQGYDSAKSFYGAKGA